VVFGKLAPLSGIHSILILDLPRLMLPSNTISKLSYSLLQAFLAPNNSIRSLLVRHFHVDFSVEIICNFFFIKRNADVNVERIHHVLRIGFFIIIAQNTEFN
jgi:hypothetical protein